MGFESACLVARLRDGGAESQGQTKTLSYWREGKREIGKAEHAKVAEMIMIEIGDLE
jgi:hypothetical protein